MVTVLALFQAGEYLFSYILLGPEVVHQCSTYILISILGNNPQKSEYIDGRDVITYLSHGTQT